MKLIFQNTCNGTLAIIARNIFVTLPTGLEPVTYGLTVRRSTNWAIEANIKTGRSRQCAFTYDIDALKTDCGELFRLCISTTYQQLLLVTHMDSIVTSFVYSTKERIWLYMLNHTRTREYARNKLLDYIIAHSNLLRVPNVASPGRLGQHISGWFL